MAKALFSLFPLLIAASAYAETAEAPAEKASPIVVVVFLVLFVGGCAGYFLWMWWEQKKRRQQEAVTEHADHRPTN